MNSRKKLIEVALPLDDINAASAAEKANPFIKGHPRQIHVWFARRPLASARAIIFASIVDDPDSPNAPEAFVKACKSLPSGKHSSIEDTPRRRLFDFIDQLSKWENTTNYELLNHANDLIKLSTEGNPPQFLDPFGGGGSIPLEAQRLGLISHASDLNPIPVIINKALIELPPQFQNLMPINPEERRKVGASTGWIGVNGLAADLRYYGMKLHEKAYEQLSHLYPSAPGGEQVVAWIWARTVKSPNPAIDVQVPLVRSFTLGKKKGRRFSIVPKVGTDRISISYEIQEGLKNPPSGTVGRSGGTCIISGVPIPLDYIREEAKSNRMHSQLLAIVAENRGGNKYYSPNSIHESAANVPDPAEVPTTFLPDQALGFRVQNYGITMHKQLFTARQLTTLVTFSKLLEDILSDAEHTISQLPNAEEYENYVDALRLYLAMAISSWTNYMSTICTWNSTNENVKNVFARHALPMTWDFAETNPFGNKLNYNIVIEWIAGVLERLPHQSNPGHANQVDATQLDSDHTFLVSTDPPYYDNIGYADLSDFFYVWLRQTLREQYPNIFSTMLVPKGNELIADPHRFNSRDDANRHFENGLEQAFNRIRSVQR